MSSFVLPSDKILMSQLGNLWFATVWMDHNPEPHNCASKSDYERNHKNAAWTGHDKNPEDAVGQLRQAMSGYGYRCFGGYHDPDIYIEGDPAAKYKTAAEMGIA